MDSYTAHRGIELRGNIFVPRKVVSEFPFLLLEFVDEDWLIARFRTWGTRYLLTAREFLSNGVAMGWYPGLLWGR